MTVVYLLPVSAWPTSHEAIQGITRHVSLWPSPACDRKASCSLSYELDDITCFTAAMNALDSEHSEVVMTPSGTRFHSVPGKTQIWRYSAGG